MYENIGKNIKFYRKQRGFTQDQLAEAVGFSTQSLKQLENNINLTGLDNFVNICKTLDIPSDFILADEDKKFKIAAVAQMMEKLAKLDDDEFNSIAKAIEMIYVYKTFDNRIDED